MKIIAAGPLGPWIALRPDSSRLAETRLPSGSHGESWRTPRLAEDRGERAMKWTIAAVLLTAAAMSLAIALVDTSHLGGQAYLSSMYGAQGWAATHTVQR